MQTDLLFKLKKHIEGDDLVCVVGEQYALLILHKPSVRENAYGLGSGKHLHPAASEFDALETDSLKHSECMDLPKLCKC